MPLAWVGALVEAALVIAQAGLLAWLLSVVIIDGAGRDSIWPVLIALLLVWLSRAGLTAWRGRLNASASQQVRQRLRGEVFDAISEAGPTHVFATGSGALSTQLIEQIDQVDAYYARYLPQTAMAMAVPVLIVLAVFTQDVLAGGLLLLTAPLIPVFMILIGFGAQSLADEQQSALSRLTGLFHDRLRGLDTLRRFAAEAQQSERLGALSDDFRTRTMKVLRVAFLSSAVLEFFSAVAIATLAIYIGLGLLNMIGFAGADTLTLFKGLFILVLAPEFFNPMRTLASHWHDRASALAAAEQLQTTLNTPPARPTPARPAQWSSGQQSTGLRVTLQGIGHRRRARWVLDGIDMIIEPGEKVLIQGISGSGKSTLLSIIAGFMAADVGRVELDGHDINRLNRGQLARLRGYMGQQPIMPPGSIEDIVRFGDEEASTADLHRALNRAGLQSWIDNQPAGLATMIGQDGLGLSGGQRRRLALARMLLRPRPLWILDEPTASLDEDSEQALWLQFIAATKEDAVTQLCASHSPHARAWADRVLVLKAGHLEPSHD